MCDSSPKAFLCEKFYPFKAACWFMAVLFTMRSWISPLHLAVFHVTLHLLSFAFQPQAHSVNPAHFVLLFLPVFKIEVTITELVNVWEFQGNKVIIIVFSCLPVSLPFSSLLMSSSVSILLCVFIKQCKQPVWANLIWCRKHISGPWPKRLGRKWGSNS